MKEMRPYIKEWYEYLAQGKLMGLKCPKCGRVECPPVPVCNECSCADLEWVEMSGKGKLTSFSWSALGLYPYTMDDAICGWIELEEGCSFSGTLLNPPEDQEELMKRLPLPVEAEIVMIEEENNLYYPAFRIVE